MGLFFETNQCLVEKPTHPSYDTSVFRHLARKYSLPSSAHVKACDPAYGVVPNGMAGRANGVRRGRGRCVVHWLIMVLGAGRTAPCGTHSSTCPCHCQGPRCSTYRQCIQIWCAYLQCCQSRPTWASSSSHPVGAPHGDRVCLVCQRNGVLKAWVTTVRDKGK